MSLPLEFSAIGRLASPDDNVAIAIRRIEAGSSVTLDGRSHAFEHTLLEGHRFAVRPIAEGSLLLSWGMPFGIATRPIAPAGAISNRSMIEALAVRNLDARLLEEPNFADRLLPFDLDPATFRAAPPVEQVAEPRTFRGYRRPGRRGTGTRNAIVILGTTSRTASFARLLAERLQPLARLYPGLDGIVAVAHTEGGGPSEPNNAAEVLKALAGFMVHPNVGAVLAVDYGVEPITNQRLKAFMDERGYPLAEVPHAFLSIRSGLAAGLAEGEKTVKAWLGSVSAIARTDEPLSGLRIALQCGGSDAFSGVSGNPLAGAIVHEVIRNGGTGVLCETDELSGAEAYALKAVKDIETARAVLGYIAAFKARLGWHGVTPESNPSAGNKLRGLYNIALKSLGAVHKKDPRTRIDYAIDYAEPLGGPGFYFMNSPGNDLEGIAGQVGAGCNLFLFVTGNGSITNFPFVPTLKLTTTTRRHELLVHEMDINAGRYLDGEPMESLVRESVDLVIETASGRRTKGEKAGHSQTSLWRNWRQSDTSHLAAIRAKPVPSGRPLVPVGADRPESSPPLIPLSLIRTTSGFATERIGLVLPTSMCSAQIARLAATRLNETRGDRAGNISRYVALAHSEGCGFGGESMYALLHRTYRGYATHPNVAAALLLEHGCEKIPNDAMRRHFESKGLPLDRFGWASVQLDGGIDRAIGRVVDWFEAAGRVLPPLVRGATDQGALRVGLLSAGPAGPAAAQTLGQVAEQILGAGGSVLIPSSDPLLSSEGFRRRVLGSCEPLPTLAYGEALSAPGLHLVDTETDHWVETLTGLGACGAHLFVGLAGDASQQGHPLIPLIQVAEESAVAGIDPSDFDLILSGDPLTDAVRLSGFIGDVAQGRVRTRATMGTFVDFQLSRGLLGVST